MHAAVELSFALMLSQTGVVTLALPSFTQLLQPTPSITAGVCQAMLNACMRLSC
jgi:hypothetical protein